MITKFKLFESNQYGLPEYLYHGSDILHDFSKTGNIYKKGGTFLTTSKDHASVFGKKIYKVKLNPNLNLFDSTKISECDKIFDYVNSIFDIEDSYGVPIIFNVEYPENSPTLNTPELLANYRDNWKILEKNIIWNWLLENYDGVILTEMNSKNVFIKNPVKEKILSYEIIILK
jgi:hypothetical protein